MIVEISEVAEEAGDARVGDALFIVGYATRTREAHDALLQQITRVGEVLLASDRPWWIRRLAAPGGERDTPTRRNVRREIDALFSRRATARVVVVAGEVTRTVEGLSLVCSPELGSFREDATVPLEWIGERLRATSVATIVLLAAHAGQGDPGRWLAALGATAAHHLVIATAGPQPEAVGALREGLAHADPENPAGIVTLASLGQHLEQRLGGAALRLSTAAAAIVAPRTRSPYSAPGVVASDRDALVGTELPGQFRIDAEIGRGGFAIVYRARQQLVGRDVAIKVLQDHLPPDAAERFLLETQIVARLDHRNIVRVLHADRARDGRMFVAMELLSGRTLQQILDDTGALAAPRAVAIAAELLAALAAAHAGGVIHADVKPANIFIEHVEPERVVLLDFGLSRLRAAASATSLGGTPAYMAPEQLRDGRVTESSDLYAAAVVVIAMLTGRCPDASVGPAEAVEAIEDPRLRTVLRRAIAEDPADRFASAADMSAALAGDAIAAMVAHRPPFRPVPFDESEHAEFFGRQREIEVLLEHVLFRRAVIYVAPSGTGKTSLLRAGLSPQLARLGVRVVYVACRPGLPDGIATAVAPDAVAIPEAIARHHRDAQRRLVIVVDQIEAALVGTAPDTIVERLGIAEWPADAQVCVVLSVREEYLARLLDRTQRIEPGIPVVRLGPLTPEAARTALEGAFAARGLALEPVLLDELIVDLERAAARLSVEMSWTGGQAIYPPHLQLAGAVLYEALPAGTSEVAHALYRELGGLDRIIAEHLHHVLEGELSPEHTAIARDVLLALVTSSHTRAVRSERELVAIACGDARSTRAGDVPAAARAPETVRAVLAFLRDRGLLVVIPGPTPDREPLWDLAHDSLVQRIEAWITSIDLARLRALELVRYHLRRSDARTRSLLGIDELREIDAHLVAPDLVALDGEWADRGTAPATSLLRASRRAIRVQRGTIAGVLALAVGGAALLAVQWQDERASRLRETRLRDRDIGHFVLELRAVDWDPVALATRPPSAGSALELDWELRRPDLEDEDSPGAPFADDDVVRHPLSLGASLRSDHVAARGGPAVLVVHRRDAGQPATFCRDVVLPIRRLPGYAAEGAPVPRLAITVPSCAATRADMIEIPAGPFIAGGRGDPPAPYTDDQLPPEATVDLPGYWIDRTEVTLAAMSVFVAMQPLHGIADPPRPKYRGRYAVTPRHAASAMTWREARAFCRYLGKDLPTMDQWDKALRGGTTLGGRPNPCPRRNFAWCGDVQPGWANLRVIQPARGDGEPTTDQGWPRPVPTSEHDVSLYGVADMVGNLQEWTRSPELAYFSFPADLPLPERVRRQTQPGPVVITRGCNWGDVECATAPLTIMPIPNPRLRDVRYFTLGARCIAEAGSSANEVQ